MIPTTYKCTVLFPTVPFRCIASTSRAHEGRFVQFSWWFSRYWPALGFSESTPNLLNLLVVFISILETTYVFQIRLCSRFSYTYDIKFCDGYVFCSNFRAYLCYSLDFVLEVSHCYILLLFLFFLYFWVIDLLIKAGLRYVPLWPRTGVVIKIKHLDGNHTWLLVRGDLVPKLRCTWIHGLSVKLGILCPHFI